MFFQFLNNEILKKNIIKLYNFTIMKIILEGPIGVGKTTFLNTILDYFKNKQTKYYDSGNIFFNNLSPINILKIFNDRSFPFTASILQHNFLFNLYYLQNVHIKENIQNINIFSRTPYSAHEIFTKTMLSLDLIKDWEYEFLNKYYYSIIGLDSVEIDYLFILTSSLENNIIRLKERNDKISEDYIKKLYLEYQNIEQIIKKHTLVKNTIIINTDMPLNELIKYYNELIEKVFK